ncbi:hypothetical protein BC941DRAFT_444771 [Chlamydoabsidia padenii]|nr:hypothetical protein BC941DRAFT_444771 [Chlamydoabsidia padenii]
MWECLWFSLSLFYNLTMSVFEITDLLDNLSQLDTHLFKSTQQSLELDIHAFVSTFDDEIDTSSGINHTPHISPDDLATTFIQLNNCQLHLDLAKKQQNIGNWDLNNELNDMKQTMGQVKDILNSQEQKKSTVLSPLETQRQQFLDELQQRRKQQEQDIQRQYDKLEEHYAKKTRESIYQNLVGSNAWLNEHRS